MATLCRRSLVVSKANSVPFPAAEAPPDPGIVTATDVSTAAEVAIAAEIALAKAAPAKVSLAKATQAAEEAPVAGTAPTLQKTEFLPSIRGRRSKERTGKD